MSSVASSTFAGEGRAPTRTATVITIAERVVQANALRLLLSMTSQIDVLSSMTDAAAARDAIIRTRPDVVVLECTDDGLRRFRSVLDLQLAMPKMGFVLILSNRTGATPRRPPVDRAMLVLPAQFSLADLLSSVASVAASAWVNWDGTEMQAPVAI